MNENDLILLEISLKFVLGVRINNITALVQIMARRRPAIIWTNADPIHGRVYTCTALGGDELIKATSSVSVTKKTNS